MPLLVASVIIERRGKFLAGRRKGYDDEYNGLYCTPGGKVEKDEKVGQAAVRECLEETGLLVKSVEFIGFQEPVGFLIFFFLALDYSGTPQLREPEKCERWEWIDWTHPMTPGLAMLRDGGWKGYQKLRLQYAQTLYNLTGCQLAKDENSCVCSDSKCITCGE